MVKDEVMNGDCKRSLSAHCSILNARLVSFWYGGEVQHSLYVRVDGKATFIHRVRVEIILITVHNIIRLQ